MACALQEGHSEVAFVVVTLHSPALLRIVLYTQLAVEAADAESDRVVSVALWDLISEQ